MASNYVPVSDIKCLEHQTLKVPYEVLNKKFRVAQKSIDREVQKVHTVIKELEKCIDNPATDMEPSNKKQQISQAIIGVTEKLIYLKRKAEEVVKEEIDAAKSCKRRIDHLKENDSTPATPVSMASTSKLNAWKRKRLDRMLVEYFLRSGYYNTALKLAKCSGIEDLTNIDLFLVSKEVEAGLMMKDTTKCLAWCQDNKSKLKKLKSTLEFKIHQQEFIELVKAGKRVEAIWHARKYVSSLEDPLYSEIQKTMALLAFPLDTQIAPYKELLDEKRWQLLIDLFRKENYKLYQMNNDSIFILTLQAGLSALKTPLAALFLFMFTNCPVCLPLFNSLACRLPYAHTAQSKLFCFISGEQMNEYNQPTMLPNGYVYGYNALKEMAEKSNNVITCPRTNEVFNFADVQKVFVM
ncbi:hypothetical protein HELRODRAFT_62544 [Helobdella robusta]|uniref:E3 ubiquitin-protein transferase MAEA n=1 Tax=Helobdella robusta TaxID=6412 RepID=T1FX21_HELRO|nr:hypothetical protein HELRODRAFT_62544 [Helobdella robusta]ESO12961.1 hypothetical protein HELRODRAFT_62544 [Helobdella robusta]